MNPYIDISGNILHNSSPNYPILLKPLPKKYKYKNKYIPGDSFAKTNEQEVYRLTPKEGFYYFTTTRTRTYGIWPDQKYFTKNKLEYVGKFLIHESIGYHDNAQHWDLFELVNDSVKEIKRVDYTYEGTTCFLEFPSEKEAHKLMIYQTMEIINFIKSLKQPKIILEELIKRAFSPSRTRYAISFCEDLEEHFSNV
jgi:hypothetical protein